MAVAGRYAKLYIATQSGSTFFSIADAQTEPDQSPVADLRQEASLPIRMPENRITEVKAGSIVCAIDQPL